MPVDLFSDVPFLVHEVEPAVRDAIRTKALAYLETASAKKDVTPSPEESVVTCGYLVFPDPIGERRAFREFTKTAGRNLRAATNSE